MSKINCPIINSHNKLIETHILWHQTADFYQDPQRFNANLNATIQSLRNITFALQSEKDVIPNFHIWYPSWQERMRNDEVLAWLNNSRVNIVHKSNLETKSRAIVIIKNYLDLATLTIELPSFLPNEAILLQLYTESPIDLKSRQTEHSIITIERRWIEDNLPNWELLEALRHAFMVIKEIIQDAHVQCTMNTCNLIDQLHGKAILSDYYECMDNFRNFRFRTYSTKDGRELTIKTFSQSADPDLGAKAVKRYNISKDNIILHPEANISELAEIYLNHAKKVLIKDKYHIPLVLLRLHDKSWQMLSFQTYKREEKYHIWHEIGDLVGDIRQQSKGGSLIANRLQDNPLQD